MKQIPLSGKNGMGKFALVDDEDYPLLSRLNWCLHSSGYARNLNIGFMHSLVLGFPRTGGTAIDHKDRNPLNNQKSNLRKASQTNNMANVAKFASRKFTSVYKGVYLVKRDKTWCSKIRKNGKQLFIGQFKNERHAALAYDIWAKDLNGEFAYLNFSNT